PPAPPQPPQPMAQEDENQLYFSDQDHPVLPDDPHQDHVRVMQEFQESPYWGQLSPTGRQMAERHYAQHMGFLYRMGAMNGTMGGPGGNSGMAAPAPNGGPPGGGPPPGVQGPGVDAIGGPPGQPGQVGQ
ncbi:MAG TPA: hypothetical protein VFS51_02935, partial [Gemmatimonadales bacterium]|nr:hypothetical protein [Gemmatimonadales bacterium]